MDQLKTQIRDAAEKFIVGNITYTELLERLGHAFELPNCEPSELADWIMKVTNNER